MIQISDHFDYKRLLRYTFPSIIMLVFTSIYGVVDGFFVSNFAGKAPFAAVNFIMPLLMILGCVGFMFGTGGSALIAKTLGEGKSQRANELFTLIVRVSALCGLALAAVGFALLRPLASLMGADGKLLEDSILYGRIILPALPFYILQYEFQCLFATAGKPKLGLGITAAAGVTNMVLDALFVAVFSWGLVGAAAATALSQLMGGIIPLIYFGRENSSLLRFVKCKYDGAALLKTCTNGASELMSNISMSIVSMLYNLQLMKYAGADGIAAYGVLMYEYDLSGHLYRLCRGCCPGDRLPLWGTESHGTQKSAETEHRFDRYIFRFDVHGRRGPGKAPFPALCGLRCRAPGYDRPRFCHILVFLPVFRYNHPGLILFHGPE